MISPNKIEVRDFVQYIAKIYDTALSRVNSQRRRQHFYFFKQAM